MLIRTVIIMKSISIIVPAYNCAGYIEKCIDSLLMQKGAELEIIVVNDGSKDNLEEVLEKYQGKIRLITTENGGAASARNVGLENAGGDFVMFVDSDDYLHPDCIENIIKSQQSANADIVRFGYRIVFEDGSSMLPYDYFDKYEYIEKKDFKNKIYCYFINGIRLNSVCTALYKREIVSGIRFRNDMKTAEDAVFSAQAYTNAESALMLPDAYYMYYQSGSGLTGSALSVMEKYRCNFILSGEIMHMLPKWGMSSPVYFLKTILRPAVITFSKIKRLRKTGRKNEE